MSEGPADFRLDGIEPTGAIARSVGLVRQAMAADLVTRGDGWERGVRSVLLQNDRISIEVVVDRALDIASARVRQIPIAWRSPTEIVAPWFVENSGFGPHRGFFGGLLTTCGLDHIGAPVARSAERFGYRARATDAFPMHGRISGSPARLSAYGVSEADGGLEAFVEGVVTQVAVFGEYLALTRRISIAYGSAVIRVDDHVANHGYASSPLAVMYHVNMGWPVVAPGARVKTPPRRLRGEGDNSPVRAPSAGAAERVWIFAADPDGQGRGTAGIANAHVDAASAAGARLTWDATALPTLVQWEMANVAGHYVIGLEPSTAFTSDAPDGTGFPILEPGQSKRLGVAIELLHGAAGSDLLGEQERMLS
jgi:hypothetical protein